MLRPVAPEGRPNSQKDSTPPSTTGWARERFFISFKTIAELRVHIPKIKCRLLVRVFVAIYTEMSRLN